MVHLHGHHYTYRPQSFKLWLSRFIPQHVTTTTSVRVGAEGNHARSGSIPVRVRQRVHRGRAVVVSTTSGRVVWDDEVTP